MTTAAKLPSEGGWKAIEDAFFASGDASKVLQGRSEQVDRTVVSAWQELLAPAAPSGMALLAVGGYGRRELFPYSDVDLLLLTVQTPEGAQKTALEAFLRSLWDKGLRLSHSVRTVRECCAVHEDNVELSISLLDRRQLAGDENLYAKLDERLPKFLHAQRQSLIRKLCELTRPRHAKYQHTIYHLEPNVKEAPGGLRDLHLLWWLDQLRDDPVVASEWLRSLEPSRDFLWTLRCFLHFRAGRDDNSLTFSAQEEFAEQDFLPFDNPESWMRHYFFHARSIHRAAVRVMDLSEGQNSSLLKGFRQWRSRLSNAEFTVSRERVFFKSPRSIPYDPELVLRLFQFLGRHDLRPALETERKIAENLPALEQHFAQKRPHWAAVFETLNVPHAFTGLFAMHESGVMSAVFPEWKRVECLVVRDFNHRYTVDEHTLLAVKSLEDLHQTSDPRHKRFESLMAEIDDPAALRLAILLHDLGKGEGTGEHVRLSVEVAEQAMERIQLPVRKRALVRFLIERHLELSAAMSRDLDDPVTARHLAEQVGTVERLKYLTLLTYADISAVNPTALSPWKAAQLWLVYLTVYNELNRELDTDRIHEPRSVSPKKAAFLEGFPSRYLRTHSDEEIDGHLELDRQAQEGSGVAVKVERRNGVYDMVVLCPDRPHLLASLAGTLASFGLNILKAEAFANNRGTALDTFAFEDPKRNLELNPSEVERLSYTIEKVARGKLRARNLLKNRVAPPSPSQGSQVEATVSFNNDASDAATLIELVAQDRPGLLYDVTRRLSESGCDIKVVLLDTEAHKAIDVVYVTYEGRKLPAHLMDSLRTSLLEAAQG